MPKKTQRHYHHAHEEALYKRLKLTVAGIILLPVLAAVILIFFGPTIGLVFSFISVNRGVSDNQDTIAPPVPIFDNPPTATKDNHIILSGFAEPGSTIKLFVNGPETQTNVASADGTFRFEGIELINGNNTIFAKAFDTNNNESDKSTTLAITYDTQQPEITIDEPKDNTTVKNLNGRIFIKGKISEKVSLKINDKFVILKPDLSFEYPLGVDEGWIEVKVVAEDEAGNINEETFKVNYVRGN